MADLHKLTDPILARAREAADRSRRRAPHVTGIVEEFGREIIEGWVAVPSETPPVAVALTVRRVVVARTWAVPHDYRSGSLQIRRFRFLVQDMWGYLRAEDTVVIRANRQALPIVGHGMHARVGVDGTKEFAVLAERLRAGWIVSKNGRLQRPRTVESTWQRDSSGLADRLGHVLAEEFGLEWFTTYGALLGAVRNGAFIDHDNDVDLAYLSAHSNGPAAAEELERIATRLIERGFWVRCLATHLSIRPYEGSSYGVDLFHHYFDESGILRFPFGMAGTTEVTRAGWKGTTRMPIHGGELTVPVDAERFVEALYGAHWRQPDPGFAWWRDRTARAKSAHLSEVALSRAYWTNFWTHTEPMQPSTFYEWATAHPDLPGAVVDLGCGAGRDAHAFAAAGRSVLGVDRCSVAIERAAEQAEELDADAAARFEICHVGEAERLRAILHRSAAHGRVLFYARFLLHLLTTQEQDALLDVLASVARPGDMVALEFRTTADATLPKANRDPVRRFQDGAAVTEQLHGHGFRVVAEQEGRGLAPYRKEDPALYRVLARFED